MAGIPISMAEELFPIARGKDPRVKYPTHFSELTEEAITKAAKNFKTAQESERVLCALLECTAEKAAANYREGLQLGRK